MQKLLFYSIALSTLLIFGCRNHSAQEVLKVLEISASDLERKTVEGNNIAFYDNEPFTGKVFSYYPDGTKYIQQSYLNGVKEGEWAIWYEGGQMQKLGYVVNGLEDSVYREWYPNGQMRYEYHYADGERTGRWDTWYDSGVKWTERDFSKDMLHGKVNVYDTDGSQTKEMTYRNNQLVGRRDLRTDEQKKEGGQ